MAAFLLLGHNTPSGNEHEYSLSTRMSALSTVFQPGTARPHLLRLPSGFRWLAASDLGAPAPAVTTSDVAASASGTQSTTGKGNAVKSSKGLFDDSDDSDDGAGIRILARILQLY